MIRVQKSCKRHGELGVCTRSGVPSRRPLFVIVPCCHVGQDWRRHAIRTASAPGPSSSHSQQPLSGANVSTRKHVARDIRGHIFSWGQQTPETPVSSQGLSVQSVTTALVHASRAWDKFDVDRSGNLSIAEAVELLNSHELQDAALLLTNVAPTRWHHDELQPMFAKADTDRSGALTRSEFLALYLAVTTQRVRKNPLVLAEALFGFLDVDRNGKIEGKELKVLLTLLGFPVAVMLPIPTNFGVDYRAVLRTLGGYK